MRTTKKSPDLSAIAQRFRVTVRTVRSWKAEGAPLENLRALRLWLAGRKHAPSERHEAAEVAANEPTPATASNEPAGAAAALRRLERAEVTAYDELTAALASNEPLRIRAARQNWLAIGDSLRKYELAVEQNRRDAGELRPTQDLLDALRLTLYGLRLSATMKADQLCELLEGKSKPDMRHLLGRYFTGTWFDALTPLFAEGKGSWFRTTLDKVVAGYVDPLEPYAAERVKLYLGALDCLEKRHELTDTEAEGVAAVIRRAHCDEVKP